MLQFTSNVPACFKPHFRVLCLSHFRVTNTAVLQLKVRCTNVAKCQNLKKPLRALNFIRRTVRRGKRTAPANTCDSRNDGIPSPTDFRCIYLCQRRQLPPIAVCKLRLSAFIVRAAGGGRYFGIRKLIPFWASLSVTLRYVSVPVHFDILTCSMNKQAAK